jgi:hypothetical protein
MPAFSFHGSLGKSELRQDGAVAEDGTSRRARYCVKGMPCCRQTEVGGPSTGAALARFHVDEVRRRRQRVKAWSGLQYSLHLIKASGNDDDQLKLLVCAS